MTLLIVLASFVLMEAVSYGTHRWIMHAAGMRWHRSHHRPQQPGFEANDVFPVLFSVIGFTVFALSAWGPRIDELFWAGVGITAYGLVYAVIHEIYIHERLPISLPRWRYLEWVKESHRIHHLFGGEPYGMLFPVVPRSLRERAAARSDAPIRRAERRESTREIRSRL